MRLSDQAIVRRRFGERTQWGKIRKDWDLYLFVILPFAVVFIFKYLPIYGIQLAFKQLKLQSSIWDSPWVGFEHFERLFRMPDFAAIFKNTLIISLLELAVFPVPIILAIMLNQVGRARFKKWIQMITYAPHLISAVVVVGIFMIMLSPRNGIVNEFIATAGGTPIHFLGSNEWFRVVFISSGLWQHMGFNAVIFLAALSAIDPGQTEAAIIDGANRWRRIWHIDIPGISNTIIILFILKIGQTMNLDIEKILLFQSPLNISVSEVIGTYVYKAGILQAQYGFATAVGLFNNIINVVMLLTVNYFAKKYSETSLF